MKIPEIQKQLHTLQAEVESCRRQRMQAASDLAEAQVQATRSAAALRQSPDDARHIAEMAAASEAQHEAAGRLLALGQRIAALDSEITYTQTIVEQAEEERRRTEGADLMIADASDLRAAAEAGGLLAEALQRLGANEALAMEIWARLLPGQFYGHHRATRLASTLKHWLRAVRMEFPELIAGQAADVLLAEDQAAAERSQAAKARMEDSRRRCADVRFDLEAANVAATWRVPLRVARERLAAIWRSKNQSR